MLDRNNIITKKSSFLSISTFIFYILLVVEIEFKMCSVPRINTNKTKTQFRRTYLVGYIIFIFNKLDKYFFRRTGDAINY